MDFESRQLQGSASRRTSLPFAITAVWRRHRDILNNLASLLGTVGITSVLGFAFWTFAARVFSQQAVGYASAAVSAMTLLGTIGMFGLGMVLIGELPRRKARARLVSAALLACASGSFILALGFVLAAPDFSRRFGDLLGAPDAAALFVAGVVLTAVTSVFDQATIGVLRGGLQLGRNFAFAVAKMIALPLSAVILHDAFGVGITLSWVSGLVLSLLAVAIWLRRGGSHVLARPDWGVLRGLGKTAIAHNWLNLAIAVPVTVIPVVVTLVVSPSANAAFYIAWMLSGFLYSVPGSLSTVLFAVASADPQVIARKLRFSLRLSMLIGLPGMLLLGFGAHLALSIFGKSYAREATFPLWLLCIGYLPALPRNYYVAVCRAAGKISRAAVVLTLFAAAEIAAAAVGGYADGLRGLSIGILGVAVVEGLGTTPAMLRATSIHGRHRRSEDHERDTYLDKSPEYQARQEAGLALLMSLGRPAGSSSFIYLPPKATADLTRRS
jgi:O-antigen/teichoic acid export membrane protein